MLYTPMTKKAMDICFEAHKEQKDKSGQPYVFHPFHLAEQMETEDTVIVALLHDTIEDTDVTLEYLAKEGFSPSVLDAIALMTHAPGVDYMAYVAEIKKNPIAKAVKIADLTHNSTLSRLNEITPKDRERVKRYKDALTLLTTD